MINKLKFIIRKKVAFYIIEKLMYLDLDTLFFNKKI